MSSTVRRATRASHDPPRSGSCAFGSKSTRALTRERPSSQRGRLEPFAARSVAVELEDEEVAARHVHGNVVHRDPADRAREFAGVSGSVEDQMLLVLLARTVDTVRADRKSTRLNSSHVKIS